MTHDDPSRAFWVLQGQQDKSGHRWGPADGAGHLPVPSQAPLGVRVCLSVTALRTEEPQGRTPMVSQTLRWDETFGEDVGGPDAGGRGVNLGARGQAAVDHISKNEQPRCLLSSRRLCPRPRHLPGPEGGPGQASRAKRWTMLCDVSGEAVGVCGCSSVWSSWNRPPCCEEAQESRGDRQGSWSVAQKSWPREQGQRA